MWPIFNCKSMIEYFIDIIIIYVKSQNLSKLNKICINTYFTFLDEND